MTPTVEHVILIALALSLVVGALVGRLRWMRSRRAALTALRESWGQPTRSDRTDRSIDAWWRRLRPRHEDAYDLDDPTWADLGMDRVFAWADRTLTAIGAQTLYAWMRTPSVDLRRAERRRALADALSRADEARVRVQAELVSLGDRVGWDAATILCEPVPTLPIPLFGYRAFALGLLVALIVAGVWPTSFTLAAVVLLAGVNPVLHVLASRRIDSTLTSLRDLYALVTAAARAHAVLDEDARRAFGDVESDLAASRAVMAKGGVTLQVAPTGAGTLADTLLEYGRAFFLADARAYLRTARAVELEREGLVRTLTFLGELDAGLSLAHLRATERRLCEPARVAEARLEARAIVHPLVRDAVPNDIALGPRGLLVTGSNMAGKSTFLRALGVNVIVGQTLGVTCAAELVCGPLRVFASMSVEDDLEGSVSLYQSEVLRLRTLLDEGRARPPNLFLLDEVFRGTNPRDRVAASSAVLRALAEANLVIAATHDLGLAELTEGAFELGHFSERIEDEDVVFDYRLRPGLTRQTNALQLLSRLGYPPEVVARAEAVAERLAADSNRSAGLRADPASVEA